MKRVLTVIISLFIISTFCIPAFADNNSRFEAVSIDSKNAILIETKNGTTVFSKGADEEIQIASMTKIMSCIITLENFNGDLDETFVLDENYLTPAIMNKIYNENLSTAGFQLGDSVTVRDLLYGLMLPSGAECAYALTMKTAGGIDAFIDLMNKKADDLKLNHTHFSNPEGMDDSENYSSVSDVAKMLQYGLKNKNFKEIVTTREHTATNGNLLTSTIKSKTDSIGDPLNYIKGGKTGSTSEAGLCFASFAEEDGTNLILVTAGIPYERGGAAAFVDAKKIYEFAFENFSYRDYITKGQLLFSFDVKSKYQDSIPYYASVSKQAYLPNDAEIKVDYNGQKTIDTLIKDDTPLGKVTVKCDNEILYSENVKMSKDFQFNKMCYIDDRLPTILLVCGIILMLIIGVVVISKRNKKIKNNRRKRY